MDRPHPRPALLPRLVHDPELVRRRQEAVSLYILDTDILSLLQHNHAAVSAALIAARHDGHVLALSTVTVEEQAGGWINALRTAKSPDKYALASQSFAEAVPLWGQLLIYPETVNSLGILQQLIRAKLNVRKNDLRVASVALDRSAILVTHNLVDFRRVPNLMFVDWAAPLSVFSPPPPPAP
jgi:tRNA(fMet)-specific endonuclease VapC